MHAPVPSRSRPSLGLSIAIFIIMTAGMAILRLVIFREDFVALTYGLPLLICLVHRDRRLLWSMVAAFAAMAAYKAFWLMPQAGAQLWWTGLQASMHMVNIGVIGAAVHGLLNLTDRLGWKNEELASANDELLARAEEISRQNEELQMQSEELAQQNEEIQTQSEELAQQNEELQQHAEELSAQFEELQDAHAELNHREAMLRTLLDSVHDHSADDGVLRRMCDSALPLLGEAARDAAVVEMDGGELVVRARAAAMGEEPRQNHASSLAALVMEQGRTAFIEDVEQRPDIRVPDGGSRKFRSILATPFLLEGKPAGAVEVYACEPRQWTTRHFRAIEWIAAQASLILAAKRLARQRLHAEQTLEKQNQRLRLLSDSLRYLLSARDARKVAKELFPRVAEHLGLDTYVHFLIDEEGKQLKLHSCAGLPSEIAQSIQCLQLGEGLSGEVARQQKPIVAERIQENGDARTVVLRQSGLRSYACHPLMTPDRLIGTLAFASRDRDEFKEDELGFIRTISQYVSIALDRLQTEAELERSRLHLESEVEKRTSRLTEAVGELEHFSYTITHDMRAPLRSMTGFGEILLEEARDGLEPQHQDYLHRIMKSAERMDALIRDALNYSKIVREQMPLSPVNTQALIEEMLLSYPGFQPPHATIEVEGPLPPVLGNQAGLTQCFSNLLHNAVKFVRPGEAPHVRIRAQQNGRTVRIWVEDNGIGIEKTHLARLFGMFQRLNRDYEGTGIGLALVRKVAERMGGQVGVESEPGKGSRFWVELKSAEPALA